MCDIEPSTTAQSHYHHDTSSPLYKTAINDSKIRDIYTSKLNYDTTTSSINHRVDARPTVSE